MTVLLSFAPSSIASLSADVAEEKRPSDRYA